MAQDAHNTKIFLFFSKVSKDKINKDLAHAQGKAYYSTLSHAFWCPFSRKDLPTFDALRSIFPQIMHLAVEESSVMSRCKHDE